MKFLHLLVFVGLCEAFPRSRRHVGSQGVNVEHPHIVGSADPRLAQSGRPVAASFRSLPNVRQVNPPTDRVDMFGSVGASNQPNRPAYTHSQGAIEITGGIVNIRGGMVNAVGGVVNVVGARINRIPAPVYATINQPSYGVRTSGQRTGDGRRIGTLSLNQNPGIVNGNDSTVTIVGGTVNLFEGYSVNDPNLPPAFTTPMKTGAPSSGIAAGTTQPPVTAAPQTAVPTVTTTTPPPTTNTTVPNTTTEAPTTTSEPTTLSPVDAWYLEGCQDAFARAEIPSSVTGFGPLDDNCGIYVNCEKVSGKIVATYTTCPGQQWFSNATGICGIPDGDVCPWSPCNGAIALFVADPATCYGYYECEGGAAQFATCPPGYLFSNRTNQCHQDVLDSCPQATSIPPGEMQDFMADLVEAGLLGGPLDVGAEGGGGGGCVPVGEGQYRRNGVLMACTGGLEFDPALCSCV